MAEKPLAKTRIWARRRAARFFAFGRCETNSRD
jgi:hypothetical protein